MTGAGGALTEIEADEPTLTGADFLLFKSMLFLSDSAGRVLRLSLGTELDEAVELTPIAGCCFWAIDEVLVPISAATPRLMVVWRKPKWELAALARSGGRCNNQSKNILLNAAGQRRTSFDWDALRTKPLASRLSERASPSLHDRLPTLERCFLLRRLLFLLLLLLSLHHRRRWRGRSHRRGLNRR